MDMKSRFFYLIVSIFILSSFNSGNNLGGVVWTGNGEAAQTLTLVEGVGNPADKNELFYKFKNVRYGTVVHTGEFTLTNKQEANQFILDLKGGISKIKSETKFEWSRGKYTVASGGSASKEKGTFKIWVNDKFCPMTKKDAAKLIKTVTGLLDQLSEK